MHPFVSSALLQNCAPSFVSTCTGLAVYPVMPPMFLQMALSRVLLELSSDYLDLSTDQQRSQQHDWMACCCDYTAHARVSAQMTRAPRNCTLSPHAGCDHLPCLGSLS